MKTRLEYAIRRAMKEVRLIEAGKLHARPLEEVLNEIKAYGRSNKVKFNKWRSKFVTKRRGG